MSECNGEDDAELPAFQRSRQITNIFTDVQNLIPDLEFSDLDDDSDLEEINIIMRNEIVPVDTEVVTNGHGPAHNDPPLANGVNENHHGSMNGHTAAKSIAELSVHTFIDALVSQLTERAPPPREAEYPLPDSTDDMDLDQVINLLQITPELALSGWEHDKDDDALSTSSSSTIVMDELERLASTYDLEDSRVTPRDYPPNRDLPTVPATDSVPAVPEPNTVKIDLRFETPEPVSSAKTSHALAKKMIRPPSSDSDEEQDREAWADMRKKMKCSSTTTAGAPSVTSTGTNVTTRVTATSKGVTTTSTGVTTTSTGVTATSTGVTTASTGVITAAGVATPKVRTNVATKKTSRSIGVSTQSSSWVPQASNRVSCETPQSSNRKTPNTINGVTERIPTPERIPAAKRNVNTTKARPQRNSAKKPSLPNDNEKFGKEKADTEKAVPDKEPICKSDKTSDKTSEEVTSKVPDNRKTSGDMISKVTDSNKTNKVTVEMKRDQMKLREKRNAFRKRLKEHQTDDNTRLIFDVEESFSAPLSDVPEESFSAPLSDVPERTKDEYLVLQLMIDNQGELSSLPPEYYAYCYNDIPSISCYGLEGVLTWLLVSPAKPFTVVSARLTFINNCLTYIFLIRGQSNTLYGDMTSYLDNTTIALSDPALFSSTLLNPRDYPFCETLNKLFLLSESSQDLFSAQPTYFTSNLILDKVNEISTMKVKQKVNLVEVQERVSPEQPPEFCVTTLLQPMSPGALFHVLSSIRDTQLEIAGLRLVYTQTDKHTDKRTARLCIVVSGYSAISKWTDKLGPVDEQLALRTDPDSVRAVLSRMKMGNITITTTRSLDRTRQELARYFGCRFRDTNSTRVDHVTYPLVFERSRDYFFLLVSPLISPSLLGEIVVVLQGYGVSLLGIRRCRLNYRKCVGLGLSESQTRVFSKFNGTPLTSPSLSSSNGSTPSEDRLFFPHNYSTDASPNQPTLASTVLFVSKRNGLYHSRQLIRELKCLVVDTNLSHTIQETQDILYREGPHQISDPYLYFEVIPFSENNLWNVGGQFGLMPERKTFDFFMSHKQNLITEKSDLEQIVFVALAGKDIVGRAGAEICKLIHYTKTLEIPCNDNETGHLELLGVKLISKLNSFQARELTQYEVGDAQWKHNIQYLQTVPVIALLVRAINAFQIVQLLLGKNQNITRGSKYADRMMSNTPEHAYKLASLMFFEKELYSDEILRPKQLHLPPPRTHVNSILSREAPAGRHSLSDLPDRLVYQSEGILKSMLSPPRLLATVLLSEEIKHCGKIMKRLEQEEFTIVGLYITPGDSIVICVQAENGIYKLKQLLGPEDLKLARQLHQFSLRASFSTNENSFYGSPTYNDSIADIKTYFPQGLCCTNTLDMQAEGILHSHIDGVADKKLQQLRVYTVKPAYLKPLLQTACVVFPPDMLKCAKHTRLSPASQIITLIQSCQFEVLNMRLLILPPTQIYHLKSMFRYPVHNEMWQTFINRPCLVLALQRENAASCFFQILKGYSNTHNKKLLDTYGHLMLVSQNKQMAEEQLTFFFNFLSNRAKDEIADNH